RLPGRLRRLLRTARVVDRTRYADRRRIRVVVRDRYGSYRADRRAVPRLADIGDQGRRCRAHHRRGGSVEPERRALIWTSASNCGPRIAVTDLPGCSLVTSPPG